jgi:hypothetical protein
MPSETERIANEFMDRYAFNELDGSTGSEHSRKTANRRREGDDPDFVNQGYMALESLVRSGHR